MMVHKIIKLTCFVLLFLNSLDLIAQDDLLKMLEKQQPQKPMPVYATFKATRLISGQTNEQVSYKHLNFVIMHRFGSINNGISDLFGLDQANIRFAFDYGLNKNIQLGFARTNIGKTYDGNLKIKILRQNNKNIPVGITYYGNIGLNTTKWENPNRNNLFTSRLSYLNQLLLTKKVNDNFSFLIAPTLIHYNLVQASTDANSMFAIGLGSSYKITRSTRFNIEYYPRITATKNSTPAGVAYYNYLGIGFDIETGGHVFQLMFTNGVGMHEQHFIRQTQTDWSNAGIRLGFNIARTFSFDNNKNEKW